jgi:hypothetical protein
VTRARCGRYLTPEGVITVKGRVACEVEISEDLVRPVSSVFVGREATPPMYS